MNASNAANTSSPPNNNYNNNKWQDFGRANAWDDVPEIGQYVSDAFVHHGKNSSALANIDPTATEGDQESAMRIRGMRITDFPGDRLSLPVTPAPVRRNNYFGVMSGPDVPTAEGVPAQSDWVRLVV